MMERIRRLANVCQVFDNAVPLFHHLHLTFKDAARSAAWAKPGLLFPPQYNNYEGSLPATYFGFDPDCTSEEVRERLLAYEAGDNRITELSRAYRIQLGTGWYTPPGVVHAPGSYLTYEPQWNSDVNSVYENVASGEVYNRGFLVENLPENDKDSVDAVMELMDWEANTDPHYKSTTSARRCLLRSRRASTRKNGWFTAMTTSAPRSLPFCRARPSPSRIAALTAASLPRASAPSAATAARLPVCCASAS
ncbi:MAG: hypothetical protein ACLSB9_22925 [Hydrogeniiclostridium mannosilyticum]